MNNKTSNKNILNSLSSTIIDSFSSLSTMEERMTYLVEELYNSIDYIYWIGFYFPEENEMIIGPSAGPPACASIGFEGVCGSAYKTKTTLIVPDVDQFPGHIACDPNSKSEIVVPLFNNQKEVISVLDVDSDKLDAFSRIDAVLLEKLVNELTK